MQDDFDLPDPSTDVREPMWAVVVDTYPHEKESDNSNYEVDVALVGSYKAAEEGQSGNDTPTN